METATQNLENDHKYILRLINVMELMTENKVTSIGDIEEVINLIQKFADGFHHAKEENLLFPLLSQKGFSPEQGPVAVMLNEHIQGRNFVNGMANQLLQIKQNESFDYSPVYENMAGYAELLRSHIAKENNVLFRMADNVLSESEQKELIKEFDAIETLLPSGQTFSDWLFRIEHLEKIYHP